MIGLKVDQQTRLCGLGSDGASVMLENRGGVSKLLREKAPFLVATHCIAHRLALACGQTANETPYLKIQGHPQSTLPILPAFAC